MLGSWVNSKEANIDIVDTWLKESFSGGRHIRRLEKLASLPKSARYPKILIIPYLVQDNNQVPLLISLAKSLGKQVIVALPPNLSTYEESYIRSDFDVIIKELSLEIFNEISPDITIIENRKAIPIKIRNTF